MAKYVVFGAGGQLGMEVVHQLESRDASVCGVDRETCDITASDAVAEILGEQAPSIVFNAAGFTDVDQAESVRQRAMQVNGIGAGIVAAQTWRARARLVHFSSHYVFGSGHSRPIDEAEQPDPLSVYGASKLWGEQLVARNCPTSFIVRTSALYSRFGGNVMNRLIEIALNREKTITAIGDEFISPTPAALVAQTAIDLADTELFGTYHASTSGDCSWYDFIRTFIDELELDAEVQEVSQKRWGAAARRPRYSALDNLMLRTLGLNSFPDWETALDAFIAHNGERMIWEMA